MKGLLRNCLIYTSALFLLPFILIGIVITGGIFTYLLAGFILAIMLAFVKPFLRIFSLPLAIVTFGTFTLLAHALLLYVLTVLVPQIQISHVTFVGLSFGGFVIPKFTFDGFFAYIAAALVLYTVVAFFEWIIE